MKIVVENIFKCLVLFWKCYFPTNFSHFLDYFLSIQTNFIKKNFKITANTTHHRNSNSTHGSKFQQSKAITTKTPLPHHHTTTTEIKIIERDRWVEAEIARRWDRAARSSGARSKARSIVGLERAIVELERMIWASSRSSDCSVRSSDPETTIWASPAMSKAWSGFLLRARSLSLSLSLSLCASDLEMVWSENLSFKPFPWSKAHFPGQLQIISRKYIFHAQPNTRIYGKAFPEVVWSQNKHSLSDRWWDIVNYILEFTAPIYDMLQVADTDKPCHHLVYEMWDSMIEKMKATIYRHEGLEDDEYSSFWSVVYDMLIDRWTKNCISLHCLTHSLNLK